MAYSRCGIAVLLPGPGNLFRSALQAWHGIHRSPPTFFPVAAPQFQAWHNAKPKPPHCRYFSNACDSHHGCRAVPFSRSFRAWHNGSAELRCLANTCDSRHGCRAVPFSHPALIVTHLPANTATLTNFLSSHIPSVAHSPRQKGSICADYFASVHQA